MGEPNNIVLIFASNQLGRADFRIGDRQYSYSLDGAIVQRVKDLALRRPGAAFNLAKDRGTLITNERKGDMRRKDQEITNEPSRVADITMWAGSTYSEGIGMKKLQSILGEAVRKDVVSSYVQKFDDKLGHLASHNPAGIGDPVGWVRGIGAAATEEEKQAIWDALRRKYSWNWATSKLPESKLERALGEESATVKSEFFMASIKSIPGDSESVLIKISMPREESVRSSVDDARVTMQAALIAMDNVFEKKVVMG